MESEVVSLSIENSPVEFVLIGPYLGHDTILLRSTNAQLDLIGLSFMNDKESALLNKLSDTTSITLTSLIFNSERKLNTIDTKEVPDIVSNYDERWSSFRFAWSGFCSTRYYRIITDMLNEISYSLRQALIERNISKIEMLISPIIFYCVKANAERIRKRRFFQTILIGYGLILFITMIYYSIFVFK